MPNAPLEATEMNRESVIEWIETTSREHTDLFNPMTKQDLKGVSDRGLKIIFKEMEMYLCHTLINSNGELLFVE